MVDEHHIFVTRVEHFINFIEPACLFYLCHCPLLFSSHSVVLLLSFFLFAAPKVGSIDLKKKY